MPFTHTDKNKGDLIKSEDWNNLSKETERLGSTKLDISGGNITGDLKIEGDTRPGSNRNVLQIGNKVFVHDGVDQFIGWNSFYDATKNKTLLSSDGFAGEIRFASLTNGSLIIKPYKQGLAGSEAELNNKGVTIYNNSDLEVGNWLYVRGTDFILSGRTNPNGETGEKEPGKKWPTCRALVDGGNKLIINFEKDFDGGTYIMGHANTLGLVSTEENGHCYLEFYPNRPDLAKDHPKLTAEDRKAYIGFPDDFTKDLVIASEYNKSNSKTGMIFKADRIIRSNNLLNFDIDSDLKLKENIKPLRDCLRTLLRLEGVSFDWKDPEKYGKSGVGFVAQSVEKVLPDWVGEGSDGIKYLSIKGFEALVVEALRELKDEIESLKTASHIENQR